MARRRSTIVPMDGSADEVRGNGRWKFYLAAVIVLVIVLAWIDGGEEPIRPIVQEIELQDGNGAETR